MQGRIVILSDAASLLRRYTAGTAKAYEDAAALAKTLSNNTTIETALQRWNTLQLHHTAELINYGHRLADGSGLRQNFINNKY